MRVHVFWLAILLSVTCVAQSEYDWQNFISEITEDESVEEAGWQDRMEELENLYNHKIDINKATIENFLQIPMLTQKQIEDIEDYLVFHHGMRSLSELMAIPRLDYQTRRYLELFFTADDSQYNLSRNQSFNPIKQELSTRVDIPLYYRAGYSVSPEDGGYLGEPAYNRIIYRINFGQKLQAGVSAEKDAGEPFRHNKGWDSYGFHIQLSNQGPLKRLVIGDYRLGFGEGLVMNTSYYLGKSTFLSSPTQGIRAKTGTDEINFLRGAAASLKWSNVLFSMWISRRKWDATLNEDSTARTINESGLHRTNNELDRKGNLKSTLMGANITWMHAGFQFGGTGYYQIFDRDLVPGTEKYREIYPHGSRFGLMSLHYGYECNRFSISGETAYSTEQQGIATLHRLMFRASRDYKISIIQRYYGYHYYSFYGSAISESGGVQNENGVMFRIDVQPFRRISLYAYADFFYHPWVRYGMKHSDSGQDILLQGEHKVNRNNTWSIRYQLKRKELYNEMQVHHRIRLQWGYVYGQHWQYQTTASFHHVHSNGVALGETVRYTSKEDRWRLSLFATWFHTDDYESRVYLYEPNLYNTFSFPSFMYHGARLATTIRWTSKNKNWMVECKYGCTRYFDRDTQSSDLQEIFSPWKNDISIQLRVKI